MSSTHPAIADARPVLPLKSVDQVNSSFYGNFPYPWRPGYIDASLDQDLDRRMLNQNLGDWSHRVLPKGARIWVAGCGTSQAAVTALRFAGSPVLGSDLSAQSLALCAATAKDLGLTNLELRNESINQVTYRSQFDYILSTGVIHHNADPKSTLRKLAEALAPAGVLELMVYNRYHRVLTSAFQRAIRILADSEDDPGCPKEVALTRELIARFPVEGLMAGMLASYKLTHDVEMADALLQPVENSYTVEELEAMASSCGLRLTLPAPNPVDAGLGAHRWHLQFAQEDVRDAYDKLDDLRRWQVANHLLCEKSPMLWFYLRRSDCPENYRTEKEICESFMDRRFIALPATRRAYILDPQKGYRKLMTPTPFPGHPATAQLAKVVKAADGKRNMKQIFDALGIPDTFGARNEIRLALTTSVSPHLESVA